MATDSLRTLARNLGIPERTLRRAANEGLVHGERISERRYRTSLREEAYLRNHWSVLKQLRELLRTEPTVRLAVLFGSLATGEEAEGSDVDLLVAISDPSAAAAAELSARMTARLRKDVQLVLLRDAEQSPVLMVDALAHGRVLIDRDARWHNMQQDSSRWQRRARRGAIDLADAAPDLS